MQKLSQMLQGYRSQAKCFANHRRRASRSTTPSKQFLTPNQQTCFVLSSGTLDLLSFYSCLFYPFTFLLLKVLFTFLPFYFSTLKSPFTLLLLNKASLLCKQGLFMLRRSLVCKAIKASFNSAYQLSGASRLRLSGSRSPRRQHADRCPSP